MSQCQSVTLSGKRCTRKISDGAKFCYQHVPKNSSPEKSPIVETPRDDVPGDVMFALVEYARSNGYSSEDTKTEGFRMKMEDAIRKYVTLKEGKNTLIKDFNWADNLQGAKEEIFTIFTDVEVEVEEPEIEDEEMQDLYDEEEDEEDAGEVEVELTSDEEDIEVNSTSEEESEGEVEESGDED